jgi:hypothetical protein
LGLLATAVCCPHLLAAQDAAGQEPKTRIEWLEKMRAERIRSQPPPQEETKTSRFSPRALLDTITGGMPGLGVKVGGLVTGSGFALGPEYYRPDLANGNVVFRAFAVGSVRGYSRLFTSLEFPRIRSNRFSASVEADRVDAPRMRYFGPGTGSRVGDISTYRLERTSFDMRAGWRPMRLPRLIIGLTGGFLLNNTGPGTETALQQAAEAFPDVPGMQQQTDFLRGGPFIELDLRDNAGDPHQGTHAFAQFRYFQDRGVEAFAFRRFEGSAEQYIPFFNRKRVIALRAATELSFTNRGQQIPFYMQPTLGGSDDLRGFERFRYYGNHSFLTTVEYRWEVFPALDMAVFADAGQVFDKLDDFGLGRASASGGLGFRVKNQGRVVFRFDTALSREGFQVWLKFRNVF